MLTMLINLIQEGDYEKIEVFLAIRENQTFFTDALDKFAACETVYNALSDLEQNYRFKGSEIPYLVIQFIPAEEIPAQFYINVVNNKNIFIVKLLLNQLNRWHFNHENYTVIYNTFFAKIIKNKDAGLIDTVFDHPIILNTSVLNELITKVIADGYKMLFIHLARRHQYNKKNDFAKQMRACTVWVGLFKYLVEQGDFALLSFLLFENMPDIPYIEKTCKISLLTPLFSSTKLSLNQKYEIVEFLIAVGADVNAVTQQLLQFIDTSGLNSQQSSRLNKLLHDNSSSTLPINDPQHIKSEIINRNRIISSVADILNNSDSISTKKIESLITVIQEMNLTEKDIAIKYMYDVSRYNIQRELINTVIKTIRKIAVEEILKIKPADYDTEDKKAKIIEKLIQASGMTLFAKPKIKENRDLKDKTTAVVKLETKIDEIRALPSTTLLNK